MSGNTTLTNSLPAPSPAFPGVRKPSTDFDAVRERLQTRPQVVEIDLSTARSLAAGTQLVLPIVGNFFYVDQKANTGFATIFFQDDARAGNTPITAFSGSLYEVPYTFVVIENFAQPGQSLRVIYGVDIAFVPTVGAGVSVLNAINVNDQIGGDCQRVYDQSTDPVGTTVTTQVAPGSNLRGVLIRHASLFVQTGVGGSGTAVLMAAQVAPVAVNSNSNAVELMICHNTVASSGLLVGNAALNRRIPAGWGIFNVTVASAASAIKIATLSVEVL